MSSLNIIPVASFLVLLMVCSHILYTFGNASEKRPLLMFSGLGLGFLGIEVIQRLPGAAPHTELLFRLMAPFWILLGFGLCHFIYRLINRKPDGIYYFLLFSSLLLIPLTALTDLVIIGHVAYPSGPAELRNPFWHTLACLPGILGGIWGAVLLSRNMSVETAPNRRRAYRLILLGGLMVLVGMVILNIVLPNALNKVDWPRYGSSMFAGFILLIFLAMRHFQFLRVDVETVSSDIFEAMNNAALILNPTDTILRVNSAATNLFHQQKPHPGMSISKLLPASDHNKVTLETPAGIRHLSVSRYAHPPATTNTGWLLVIHDDTERQNARERLQKSQRHLQQSILHRSEELLHAQRMEALSTLSRGVATTFNRMLTEFMTLTAAATEKLPPANPLRDDLKEALNAAQDAQQTLLQMMTFSSTSNRRQISITDLIRNTIRLASASFPPEIRIRTDLAHNGFLQGDEVQLRRAILNVIANAIQAMSSETGVLTVSVEEQHHQQTTPLTTGVISPGAYLAVSIADTGDGIPAAFLSRIFEPFFTRRTSGKGSGLGLSTVRRIVDNHDGAIDVQSTLGQGTTFRLLFPMFAAPVPISDAQDPS